MLIFRVLSKFKHVLTKKHWVYIGFLFCLMILASFLEMLSVSLIIPFIKAVTDVSKVMNSYFGNIICSMFNIQTSKQFLITLALTLCFVYLLKNVFLLFLLTVRNKLVNTIMFITQKRLLESFLLRPYEEFLSIKSGEVIRVIGSDTSAAFAVLGQILSFFSELIVSLVLIVTIFIISPVITVVLALVLLFLMLIIQFVLKPILKKAGDTYASSNAEMNKWLLQAIQGIKELKLMKSEKYFQDNFEKAERKYIKAQYQHDTLSLIPRYSIEAISMVTFFLGIAVAITSGVEFSALIPVISAIGMAAIRLLPAVNLIAVSLSYVTFSEYSVDNLVSNLKTINEYENLNIRDLEIEKHEEIHQMRNNITLSNISYVYPNSPKRVFDNASMLIEKGKSVGIIGSSGSGKTTAVDILLGLLNPSAGSVLVDSVNIKYDLKGWLDNVGYIPQSIFLLDGSIKQNVAFGVDDKDIDDTKVMNSLKDASLLDFINSLPDGIETQIGERGTRLSGGQKQRIGIARALYKNPEVLVFDEATSALDNETEAAIMESIDGLHGLKTMVIIAHRLSTIQNCDIVYSVENGKIIKKR